MPRKKKIDTTTPIYSQIQEYLNYCENVRRMSEQTLHGKRWVCKQILKEINISTNGSPSKRPEAVLVEL